MILLDASAVLAYLGNEPGADVVATALLEEECHIMTINMAEVLQHAIGFSQEPAELLDQLGALITVEPESVEDAVTAAELYPSTRKPALSLADRFALAAAKRLQVPVLTAEKAWTEIPAATEIPGIEVRLIRARSSAPQARPRPSSRRGNQPGTVDLRRGKPKPAP